jgi:hypothetical protein
VSRGDEAQHVAQARQLERLRLLRADKALRLRSQAQAARDAAQQAVREREAEVERQRRVRAALLHAAAFDPRLLTTLAPYHAARREYLDDQLERTEYALLDDEEALAEAAERLAEAAAAWRRAQRRADAAADLHTRARRAEGRATEARAEREDPAARPVAHVGAATSPAFASVAPNLPASISPAGALP